MTSCCGFEVPGDRFGSWRDCLFVHYFKRREGNQADVSDKRSGIFSKARAFDSTERYHEYFGASAHVLKNRLLRDWSGECILKLLLCFFPTLTIFLTWKTCILQIMALPYFADRIYEGDDERGIPWDLASCKARKAMQNSKTRERKKWIIMVWRSC